MAFFLYLSPSRSKRSIPVQSLDRSSSRSLSGRVIGTLLSLYLISFVIRFFSYIFDFHSDFCSDLPSSLIVEFFSFFIFIKEEKREFFFSSSCTAILPERIQQKKKEKSNSPKQRLTNQSCLHCTGYNFLVEFELPELVELKEGKPTSLARTDRAGNSIYRTVFVNGWKSRSDSGKGGVRDE